MVVQQAGTEKTRRKGGPVTEAGRKRSGMNAIKSGITAARLLLPGESVEELEAHAMVWRTGLLPATPAEEQVVDNIIKYRWRLERLDRVEEPRFLSEADKILAGTAEGQALTAMKDARAALDSLAETIEAMPIAPTDDESLSLFGRLASEIFAVLQQPVACPEAAKLINQSTADVGSSTEDTLNAAFRALGTAARKAGELVVKRIATIEAEMKTGRARIAAGMACRDDKMAREIDRQRRRLQQAAWREIQTLNALRGSTQGPETLLNGGVFKPVEIRLHG
jgi:hypothetical protein